MSAESIGARLRRARLDQGRTIEEIANATRINRKFLEALENDAEPGLPSSYVRAFIRAYAAQVGIDAGGLLEEHAPPETAATATAPRVAPPVRSSQQSRLLLLVSGAVLLALAVSVLLLRPSNAPEDVREIGFSDVVKEGAGEPAQAAGPFAPPVADSAAARVDSMLLQATASDSVWVRVLVDGARTKEVFLAPRRTARWKAKEGFVVSAGNGGAVTLTLDGRAIGALGAGRGPVWNVAISRRNLPADPRKTAGKEGQ